MFGFGKKLLGLKSSAKKVENRDLMQAITGVCLLVAAADGTISKDETDKIDKLIRANKNLEHFGSEITAQLNLYREQLEASFRVGRMNIKREIKDIANNPNDAEEVFVNAIASAEAEGGIDEQEKAVLVEVGNMLGLRLKDFGLEG